MTLTPVGNLIAHVGGSGPRLMLAAHADEICFVVKYISDDGFVWLASGQRNPEQQPIIAQLGLPALGPSGADRDRKPARSNASSQRSPAMCSRPNSAPRREPDWNDIFLDVGATSRVEVEERGIQIGDRVIWNPPTRRMGDYVYGKAMDDRVCLAVMDRLLDVLDRDELAYEVGLCLDRAGGDRTCRRRSQWPTRSTASWPSRWMSDWSAMCPASIHGMRPHAWAAARPSSTRISSHYSRPLTLSLMASAREAGIPVQPAVFDFYGSDAGAFTRHGLQRRPGRRADPLHPQPLRDGTLGRRRTDRAVAQALSGDNNHELDKTSSPGCRSQPWPMAAMCACPCTCSRASVLARRWGSRR